MGRRVRRYRSGTETYAGSMFSAEREVIQCLVRVKGTWNGGFDGTAKLF